MILPMLVFQLIVILRIKLPVCLHLPSLDMCLTSRVSKNAHTTLTLNLPIPTAHPLST